MRIRLLLPALMLALVAALPGVAAETPSPDLKNMSVDQLRGFVETVSTTLKRDSLDLGAEAKAADCLKLTESANSFNLAYALLGKAYDEAMARQGDGVMVVRYRALQSRVVGFAARVRSEDWLKRLCGRFDIPAAEAANPRYQPVPRLVAGDYTRAAIELRQVAEANLALAEIAMKGKDCQAASSAADGIDVFIPYLDAMVDGLKARPEALGPLASLRGLEATRNRLIGALRGLDATFAPICGGPGGAAPDAAPAPDPAN